MSATAPDPKIATMRHTPLQDVSGPGRSGRIEVYIHSDSVAQNRAGAMVKVVCDTDFAARTNEFYLFARQVAKFALGCSATSWVDIAHAYPLMVEELNRVRAYLQEDVQVAEIKVMKL